MGECSPLAPKPRDWPPGGPNYPTSCYMCRSVEEIFCVSVSRMSHMPCMPFPGSSSSSLLSMTLSCRLAPPPVEGDTRRNNRTGDIYSTAFSLHRDLSVSFPSYHAPFILVPLLCLPPSCFTPWAVFTLGTSVCGSHCTALNCAMFYWFSVASTLMQNGWSFKTLLNHNVGLFPLFSCQGSIINERNPINLMLQQIKMF